MEGGHGEFDLIGFIKRPQTICRLLCILFAVIVFGCISASGYLRVGSVSECVFNHNQDACQYGSAIGVLAFLACLVYLVIDFQFTDSFNAEVRRYVLIIDLFFSGLWTFLWFVGFCFLADQWRRSPIFDTNISNHARAAITFSFFSIFTWLLLTYYAYKKFNDNKNGLHQDYQTGISGNSEYTKQYDSFPLPADHNQQYQQPPSTYQSPPPLPFGAPPDQTYNSGSTIKTDYDVPNY